MSGLTSFATKLHSSREVGFVPQAITGEKERPPRLRDGLRPFMALNQMVRVTS
jgi:hypothetical protein